MGLFKSKEEKMLETMISHVEVNMANNYKDAAQEAFKELEEQMDMIRVSGSLKEKTLRQYEDVLENYRQRLKGYTHKDQKPYWT